MSTNNTVYVDTKKGIETIKGQEIGTPDVIYKVSSSAVSHLEGQILTLIEASIADPVQRKAIKDLARPMIWSWVLSLHQ